HHYLRGAGGDRHRRMVHGGAGRSAAVADLAEECQLSDSKLAGYRYLRIAVHRERNQAIDICRMQARVVERGADRLRGQAQLAAAGTLGDLRGADPRDRGLRADRGVHRAPSGRSIDAVAMMWSPRLHRPVTAILHRWPAGPWLRSVTWPENLRVSPA